MIIDNLIVTFLFHYYLIVIGEFMKKNKIMRLSLSGGLIGLFTNNPRAIIDNALSRANQEGWYCRQVLPHATRNPIVIVFQLLLLICTVGLWTFGAGYLLLLEKDE